MAIRCGNNVRMGQFLQDGKNVHYLSLLKKKWKARVAKPSDIDDFYRFAPLEAEWASEPRSKIGQNRHHYHRLIIHTMRKGVVKIETNASGAIWWPKLELMQVTPSVC